MSNLERMSLYHTCPASGCTQTVPNRWVFCQRCWKKLPQSLKDRVNSTRETRGSSVLLEWHKEAVDAAVRSLRPRRARPAPETLASLYDLVLDAEDEIATMPIETVEAYLREEGVDVEALQSRLKQRLAEIDSRRVPAPSLMLPSPESQPATD